MSKKTAEIKNETANTENKEVATTENGALTTAATADLDLLIAAIEGNPEEVSFGEDFGGSHERVILEVGQWSGAVAFMRFETITTGDGEDESFRVPLCKAVTGVNPDGSLVLGKVVALPAAATLKRVMKDAEIGVGDVFRIQRYEDTEKKSGKGKGTMMEIYGVRVILRQKV